MNHNNENIKNNREAHTSLSIYGFGKADTNIYTVSYTHLTLPTKA